MKSQFQSTEALQIRVTAFVDTATGNYILTGSDGCTLTIRKPDGTLLTGGTVAGSWDSTTKMWTYDVASGSYVQGEWRVYAVSGTGTALPKWLIFQWGDYVNDISTTLTRVGTPTGASIAADVAAVKNVLGPPAGASMSADIAAVKSDAAAAKTAAQAAQASSATAATDIGILKMIGIGRWRVNGTQLVIYNLDGSTEYMRFDLKDDLGNPSGTRIFERVPQV